MARDRLPTMALNDTSSERQKICRTAEEMIPERAYHSLNHGREEEEKKKNERKMKDKNKKTNH